MRNSLSRRNVLQSAAGLTMMSENAQGAVALPTVKLGNHDVTRLIIGSNPFNGYSYSLPSLDLHMKEWSTPDNICKVLRSAEANGINTHQFSYHPRAMSDLKKHRDEGGKLQWILLGGGALKDDYSLIPQVAKLGPIGIAHHGGVTDQRFRAGEHAKVHEFLKRVRDAGALVGLSSHRPQNIEYAEERDWDIDFYMTCFHQLTRPEEELKRMVGEMPIGKSVFLEGDPARMCSVIQQTRKTCLAFKILGAGRSAETRDDLVKAFQFAFENIKPHDAVIVGMYPRFKDEVREDAEITRRMTMPT
jgi:hypothetical protein